MLTKNIEITAIEDKTLRKVSVSQRNTLENEELVNLLQESNAGDMLAVHGQK